MEAIATTKAREKTEIFGCGLNPIGYSYSIKPKPAKIAASIVGDNVKCGNCNTLIGIFKSADGECKCRKCKCVNTIKK